MTQPGPDATVRDLVHRGTVTVTPAATLRDAAVVMEREEVGAVVVVTDGRAAGVLSERDIVRAVANGDDVDDDRAEDVMAMDVVTIGLDASVDEAAVVMEAGNIRHLPVVDEEKIVGVVSIRDVLAAYRSAAG
mgnify:FL=1